MSASKKQWLWLVAVAAVLLFGFAVSTLLGKDAIKGCLLAIVISLGASLGGFLPVFIVLRTKPEHVGITALASTIIRLLLVVTGVAIVWHFVPVKAGWFLAWLGFFYLGTLVIESMYVLSRRAYVQG